MMKNWVLLFLVHVIPLFAISQQNNIPLNHFFKDRMYYHSSKLSGYNGNSFFPATEDDYNLQAKIEDSSKQYYIFTEHLFRKHFLEFKGKNYFLTISPVFNFALGKDFSDTSSQRLFQNTRGFYIEGDLFKNFSFSTSFYENQSRNPNYQMNYFSSIGELYVNHKDSTYYSQNAVVPGLGRTKPFKVGAFDYAFAQGDVIYKPFKVLTLSAGNTRKFVGDGYRSLLLSDNSFSSPFFQIDYHFHPRWRFTYYRTRLQNLMRKPASTTVEAYYGTKGYAVNYLSFDITEKITLSLFEGTIYSKGDSIVSKRVSAWYYNPVPLVGTFVMDEQEANSIIGLNVGATLGSKIRLYGQYAMNPHRSAYGAQLGVRLMELGDVKNLFLQLEGNYTTNNLYRSTNPRLNYSHFNLPLAHTKGEGFSEVLLRTSYEIKRAYIDLKTIYYHLNQYSSTSHLPLYSLGLKNNGSVFYSNVEIGYRFNRKMNFSVFVNYLYRNATVGGLNLQNNVVGIGLKTGIINSYTDF